MARCAAQIDGLDRTARLLGEDHAEPGLLLGVGHDQDAAGKQPMRLPPRISRTAIAASASKGERLIGKRPDRCPRLGLRLIGRIPAPSRPSAGAGRAGPRQSPRSRRRRDRQRLGVCASASLTALTTRRDGPQGAGLAHAFDAERVAVRSRLHCRPASKWQKSSARGIAQSWNEAVPAAARCRDHKPDPPSAPGRCPGRSRRGLPLA